MKAEVLLRFHQAPQIENIDVYRQNGGYQALSKAMQMSPTRILELVEQSGLRGRGGSGFPTGTKWKAVASRQGKPHYFICNAAEGEPGSFKDRELLKNPHQVLEATAIAAYAVGAEKARRLRTDLYHYLYGNGRSLAFGGNREAPNAPSSNLRWP